MNLTTQTNNIFVISIISEQEISMFRTFVFSGVYQQNMNISITDTNYAEVKGIRAQELTGTNATDSTLTFSDFTQSGLTGDAQFLMAVHLRKDVKCFSRITVSNCLQEWIHTVISRDFTIVVYVFSSESAAPLTAVSSSSSSSSLLLMSNLTQRNFSNVSTLVPLKNIEIITVRLTGAVSGFEKVSVSKLHQSDFSAIQSRSQVLVYNFYCGASSITGMNTTDTENDLFTLQELFQTKLELSSAGTCRVNSVWQLSRIEKFSQIHFNTLVQDEITAQSTGDQVLLYGLYTAPLIGTNTSSSSSFSQLSLSNVSQTRAHLKAYLHVFSFNTRIQGAPVAFANIIVDSLTQDAIVVETTAGWTQVYAFLAMSGILYTKIISSSVAVNNNNNDNIQYEFAVRNILQSNVRVTTIGTGYYLRLYGVMINVDRIEGFTSVSFENILQNNIESNPNEGATTISGVRLKIENIIGSSSSFSTFFSVVNITQDTITAENASTVVINNFWSSSAVSNFNLLHFYQLHQASFSTSTLANYIAIGFINCSSAPQPATSSLSTSVPIQLQIRESFMQNILVSTSTSFAHIVGIIIPSPSSPSDSQQTEILIDSIEVNDIKSPLMTGSQSFMFAVFSPLPSSGFSSSSSSLFVLLQNSTMMISSTSSPSCSAATCSVLRLVDRVLVNGNWNFTNVSTSSSSALPLISVEESSSSSLSPFASSAHFSFKENFVDSSGDILHQAPSFNLNSSSWTLKCNNRWEKIVETRFKAAVATDPSNPTITFEECPSTPSMTRSKSISQSNKILPPQAPTTTFASTLVPVKQYSPIPADLTEYPSFTPPASTGSYVRLNDITGKQSLTEIIQILEDFVPNGVAPAEVVIRCANPNLGTFVSVPENIPPSVKAVIGAFTNNITFTATNLSDLAVAVRSGYVYAVSPEAEARNLTHGVYVEIVGVDSGDQKGQTSIPLLQLRINQGPIPQYPDSVQATFNITRGNRFVLNLNSTFIHHQDLKMTFAAHLTDLFPLPRTVALQCLPRGNCTVRGIIDAENPLHIEIQASDGFILRASYITLVPVVVPIHINENIEMKPILFRPGQQFTYALPTNLFLSSTAIEYTAVRLATGFPLPSTMVFDAPNLLRGEYGQQGLLHLQVRASDLFFDAVRNFTLNFTNVQPFCRNDFTNLFPTEVTAANSSIPNIAPVAALQEFERTIEFSQVCADNDNDPLQFEVNPFGLPSWVRFIIQPGGFTTLPQVLRISGTPPQRAENSLLLINITVTDLFSTLILSIPLRISPNQAPRLLRPLPNYTIHPGDVESFTIDLRQHFEDPNDDPFIITTQILTDYAKTWLQVTSDSKNFLYLSMKPPDEIAGQSDDAQDSDDQLLVRIEDPFGNYTESKINIYTRLTTWQKLRTAVYIIAGLFSAFLSVLSTILLYPYVVNFFRAGSTQIPCPLNARNRKWMIPESATMVDIRDRTKNDICMWLRNKMKLISVWLYDEVTTEEFPHWDPPIWCEKIDKGLKLNNIEREPGTVDQVEKNPVYDYCFVRVYNRRGIILVQFEMKYHEVTKGWDFERVEKEEAEEARLLESGVRNDSFVSFDLDDDDDAPNRSFNRNNSLTRHSGSRNQRSNISNNNNNNNNRSRVPPDDNRWKHLDTKMMSIDMQLNEGLKESGEEMKRVKRENVEIKKKNQEMERKMTSLESLVKSLLHGKEQQKKQREQEEEAEPPSDYFDLVDVEGGDDDNDDEEIDLSMLDTAVEAALAEGNDNNDDDDDERLQRLNFESSKDAYKAKGAYDRELEELLIADGKKKVDVEKKSGVTTYNPIKQQLSKPNYVDSTKL